MRTINAVILTALAASTSSLAQAADAVVASDPEPVEYVRVCEAFGTGYFYIPGTETCLKLGGYVRFDVQGGSALGRDTDLDGDGDAIDARARSMLEISTASDTEYGALKTYTELRFNYHGGYSGPNYSSSSYDAGSDFFLYQAYIDFAGFRIGKGESAFTTYTGFAGNVIQDWVVKYGPFETNFVSYKYDNGTGLSAIVSLEDDQGQGSGYMPDLVAGVGYSTGTYGVKLVAGYDESMDAGAIKARIDGSLGGISAFLMAGWNTDGDRGPNRFATWYGDYALWGGVSAPLTEKLTLNTQLSYDEAENFAAVANVNFKVVSGFSVTPEVLYMTNFDQSGSDKWGGMIRFQRSF